MNEIASNYAEAFVELAKDKKSLLVYRDEIDEIANIFSNEKDLERFFSNVKITKDEKKSFIDSIFKDKISKDTLNFLKLLIDKGRMNYSSAIFKSVHELVCQELNIKEGIIESARALNKEDIKKLEKTLGDNVSLKPRINKTLISGFKIIFDDKVIDNSLKDKIDDLSDALLERR